MGERFTIFNKKWFIEAKQGFIRPFEWLAGQYYLDVV